MRVEELADYLVDIYEAKINGGSILLLGPPGIGKTTGVCEAGQRMADQQKRQFLVYNDSLYRQISAQPDEYFLYVELNLNNQEPSDLTGIPKETDDGIAYKPFLWARCLALPGIAGILCLDEFTNIQRLDVITASYKIVLDHLVGFTKFSDNVMVVATGNDPECSSVANLLPCPLVDRFTIYHVQEPEIFGWANWMDKRFSGQWDKRALGYLAHFPEEFLSLPAETETLENFPTPRSWTKTSLLIPKIKSSRRGETISGQLGSATGNKFFAFINTDVPSAEELLMLPEKFRDLNLDAKYLATVMIGAHLKNLFAGQIEENKKREEIEKTLPLLKVMKDIQQDLIVLMIISCGGMKTDIMLALARKDKEIAEMLEKVSELRARVEI